MYSIGQKIKNDSNYHKASIWCNANNAHIELQNGNYVIVENAPIEPLPINTTPTFEERITTLEAENESMNDMILGLVEVIDSL